LNIQLQVCGLLMLLLLLIFYKSHKTLKLYTENVFFRTMFITFLTVTFDTLSVVGIYYSDSLPLVLVKAVCKTYLALLVWSAWGTLTYILLEFSSKEIQRRSTRVWGIVVGLADLAIFVLPIGIFKDGDIIYSFGAAVTTTYIACTVLIVNSLLISLTLFIRKHSRRAFGGAFLCIIWMGAALVQFFNNQWLLVGFSQSLGMLILFVLMENPEAYIDKEYGSFNVFGLKPYVNMLYETGKEFYVAQAYIVNDDILADAGHDIDEIIRLFISSVSHVEGMYVFKDTACSMTIITSDEKSFGKALRAIVDTKYSTNYLKGSAKLISLKHAEKLSGYAELIDIIAYAKSGYINKTTEHVDIDDEIINSHKAENDVIKEIDNAIEEDRVEVFLQPIYSNKDKCFISAEALARIRLKDESMLSPGIFIPLSEKTGQIIPLGYKILEKVLEFIRDNNMDELGLHFIEVNLSVMQCEQTDLFDRVMSLVQKYNVEPRYINFEITESATISSKGVISANMQKLFDAGFSFSLDDFGKGESNLMYVVEMPVSQMKFDIDMTKAYFESYKAKSVIRAIIPMAHGLDLKLVSEGVETAKELEILSSEVIDYIQGYYFSKPLPMPEFIEFIKKYREK